MPALLGGVPIAFSINGAAISDQRVGPRRPRLPCSVNAEPTVPFPLHQEGHGASVAEVCRKVGTSEQTYYRGKKKFGEMAPSEIKKMKQLEDENRRLKGPVGI